MKRLAFLITCLGVSFAAAGAEFERTDEPPQVTVRIYDYAAIDTALLDRAQRVASSILAKGDISVLWRPAALTKAATPLAVDHAGDHAPVLILRLHRDAPAKKFKLKGWQFGYSIPSATGYSDIAGVLVERTFNFARAQGVDPQVVLGYVMAHELGHLLLGPNSHATQGIMKHRWRARELRLAQTGALGFTPAQTRKMQQLIAARASHNRRTEAANREADQALPTRRLAQSVAARPSFRREP